MTLEPAETLVERLRNASEKWKAAYLNIASALFGEAADRITALEAEVARKDEALRRMAYWFDADEDYLAGLSRSERSDNDRMLSVARAALEPLNSQEIGND